MGCCCSTARVSSVKNKVRKFPDSEDFEGPVRDRKCTDTFFLILLSVYLIFLLVAVTIACIRGDPRRLIYGVDDYGNICGFKNEKITGANRSGMNYVDMKYLQIKYCSDNSCTIKKECVKECGEGYEKTTLRRCMPSAVTETTNSILQSTLPYLEEVGSDITLCWREILLLCLISIGLSVLLLIVFRFCAAIIIWAVLLVVAAASIGGTIYIWVVWYGRKNDLEKYDGPNKELKEKQVKNWFIAAIAVTIFTVLYLLIVVFLRKRIKLAAALFQEAGKSVGAMPLILLEPVLTFISVALVCCFVLVGFICLQTSGKPLVDAKGYVTFPIDTFFQVMRWLSLFGFFWLTQFVFACQNLIVAGAVVTWYFTRDKNRLSNPILKSFRILVFFHLGSAAFGSLIIAIMKAIRALFKLLEKYLNSQNQRCDVFWKIFQCCLACFESYLKFLSKNAYIMIIIYGDSFCTSARRAFSTITANALRVAAVDGIGSFILFIGKIGVTVSVAFIALEIFKSVEGVHYIWVLVGLVSIFAFLCCHCFLSVYEGHTKDFVCSTVFDVLFINSLLAIIAGSAFSVMMTVETLLLCFCEDCVMNDGITRPYYMSKSLMLFVEGSRRSAKLKSIPRHKEVD